MAKFTLDFQSEIEIVTPGDLDRSLSRAAQMWHEAERGVKYMRIPRMTGVAAGGALALGSDGHCGPPTGYAWSVRRICAAGLTAGATPDVLNIYRNGLGGELLWQLNGNNFVYTFGRLELVLLGGESLAAASEGAFAATAVITISGEVTGVPEEMVGKLA